MIQALAYNVKQDISQTLSYLLSESYIIEELLEDVDSKTVKSFVDKYVTNSSKSTKRIPVIFGYPQDLKDVAGLVVVTAGSGQEDNQSIGFQEGSYLEGDTRLHKERVAVIKVTEDYAFLEVSNVIQEVEGIEEVSVDEVEHDGILVKIPIRGRIRYGMIQVGDYLTVVYTTPAKGVSGMKVGFTSREEVIVTVLSNNESTMVCLDIIIKATIISMRESLRDQAMTNLPQLSWTPIQPADPNAIPSAPNMIFSREYAMVSTISNSINRERVNKIKEIVLVNVRKKEG